MMGMVINREYFTPSMIFFVGPLHLEKKRGKVVMNIINLQETTPSDQTWKGN